MIAIYARVSDFKFKDAERTQDVQRQVELLSDYVQKAFPLQRIEKYVDDGESAFTDDFNQRPSFKMLLHNCRRRWVSKVVIEDMTRLSRRIDLGLPVLRELGELGIHVISLKEGELEVTSAKGWMQSAMLLMFAEWDSRVKSEKIKSGMLKARNLKKRIGRPRKGGV